MLPEFIKTAYDCGIDAAIVSDIGCIALIKRTVPELEIHVSTQAGVVNYVTANELYKMGAKRVVLAREVDIENIKRIRDNIPEDMDIEVFVHGAMCVSFSGRLSAFRFYDRQKCQQGRMRSALSLEVSLSGRKTAGRLL